QALITGLSWQVSNRVPTSNLIFEQVMPDGTARLAELVRGTLWLPSAGQNGVVAPITPGDATAITIRLRLVDLVTGNVYDEATVEVPIGTPGQSTPTPRPAATTVPETQATPAPVTVA